MPGGALGAIWVQLSQTDDSAHNKAPALFSALTELNPKVRHFRYTLDCFVTKLQETSETHIHTIVLFMNLRKKLRLLLRSFFKWLQQALWRGSEFPLPGML